MTFGWFPVMCFGAAMSIAEEMLKKSCSACNAQKRKTEASAGAQRACDVWKNYIVFQGRDSHTAHKEANCRQESRGQGSGAQGITVVYGNGILSAKIAMSWNSGYLLLLSSSA